MEDWSRAFIVASGGLASVLVVLAFLMAAMYLLAAVLKRLGPQKRTEKQGAKVSS